MKKLGIVQGRLSPPVENKIQAFPIDHWREEFPKCQRLGISCIEWIFEYPRFEENPLYTDEGIQQMLALSQRYKVKINSILADYFMEQKLFGNDKGEMKNAVNMLKHLVGQCHKSHIPIIEIPFVDSSALKTDLDRQQVLQNMKESIVFAEKYNIILSLETSLSPIEFLDFIRSFDSSAVKINYDMGNSASLGYDAFEELNCYSLWIANVHIKDRVHNGGTVPLGTGDTKFDVVFNALKQKDYQGDFILQAARQDLEGLVPKVEIDETVSEYIQFVEPYIKEFV